MTWRKDRKESHMCNWEHEMAIERERERERTLGTGLGSLGMWLRYFLYL
jgi:hypothetical protein